ncbi:MAG: PRC-barrel domain-containing protein [Gemmatimonas sp.]
MLESLKILEGYAVSAIDGEIGRVDDVLLDDQHWTVRYLVVKTGAWLLSRKVLIPTSAFRAPDPQARTFSVALTVEQVRHSPDIDTDAPVSRYHERMQAEHYGLPFYWNTAGFLGVGLYPGLAMPAAALVVANPAFAVHDHDVHLRSARELRRYQVLGIDEGVGKIDDFVADYETWAVKYLIVGTNSWWFGQQVLIAPRFTTAISWDERTIQIRMDRKAIEHSPQWDGGIGIDEEYSQRLDDYYDTTMKDLTSG